MGFESVYPAVNSISSLPQHLVGQRGAQDGWNYMNASLFVAGACFFVLRACSQNENTPIHHPTNQNFTALLNWQWSRTRGPKTTEEKIMLATLSIAGGISSFRYVQVGAYMPLFCLLVAPTASLFAWYFG